MTDGLYQVTERRACYGLVVSGGLVTDCAPYVRRWALGRRATWVLDRLDRRRARVVKIS